MNRNTKFIGVLLFVLVIASLTNISHGQAVSLGSILPANQEYEIEIITPAGIMEYEYKTSFSKDDATQRIRAYTDGPGYTTESFYDYDLAFIESVMQVNNESDVYRVGFDQRLAKFVPESGEVLIDFLFDDVSQLKKEIKLSKDGEGTEMEILGLHLQAMLLQGDTNFHGYLLDVNNGAKYRIDVNLLNAKDIAKLAAEPRMTPQVKAILENNEDVIVYSLGYNGILRLFFPTRFHIVLDKTAPYQTLAFWGGSGQALRYHLYTSLD